MTVDSGLAPREDTPYGDPKPERRITDPDAMRRFHELGPRYCQVCGSTGFDSQFRYVGLSIQHIVPRSQGGDDLEENFAMVCGSGTTGCHGHLEARTNGARESLRERFSEAQAAYVLGKKGEPWLDRHYPLPGREDDSLQGLA